MDPYFCDSSVTLHHGDCLDVLRELPDASVDAVCTDPPYGLANTDPTQVADTIVRWVNGDRDYLPSGSGFMGKAWDAFVPPVAVWDECLRVLKPGGHVLAFAGSRTMDLMTLSLRLAGFEIRDSIAWLYGSGFPKSLDVSKAIERNKTTGNHDVVIRGAAWIADQCDALGVTRKALDEAAGTSDMGGWWASRLPHRCALPTAEQWAHIAPLIGEPPEWLAPYILPANAPGEAWALREVIGRGKAAFSPDSAWSKSLASDYDITAPATPAAQQWQGWGTALKPAFEPVVVARKPLAGGTVAANVLAHGTGALNIDGCRIEAHDSQLAEKYASVQNAGARSNSVYGTDSRYRAGSAPHTAGRWPANVVLDESQAEALDEQSGTLTSGANPTRRGSDKFREVYGDFKGQEECTPVRGVDVGGASRFFYVAKADQSERPRVDGTAHPTVKPLDLMRWLVRLVTPPGGTVLEPFAGSGTTVEACIVEGFRCVAIEREADYLPLIESRIARRRNPVRAIELAGEDMGLFGEVSA